MLKYGDSHWSSAGSLDAPVRAPARPHQHWWARLRSCQATDRSLYAGLSCPKMTFRADTSDDLERRHPLTGGLGNQFCPRTASTLHPSFSWSYSRAALLDRCERLYYEHYYGSHGGWTTDAAPSTQLAFRLKHLTSPNAELGRAVHRRASEIAHAVRDGAPLPTPAELHEKTYGELESVIMRARNDPVWRANPRHAPVLHKVFYGGMSFTRRRTVLAEMSARSAVLHAALLASPVWHAAGIPGAAILFIDEPILVSLNDMSTIATPDLVLHLPNDRMIVIDWKTGATGDLSQVILYAHAVQTALGQGFAAIRCEAWLVHLDRASLEAAKVTPTNVEAALAAQRASAARMQDLLDQPAHNVPRPRAAFRQATDPNQVCRRCKMLALCSREFVGAEAA